MRRPIPEGRGAASQGGEGAPRIADCARTFLSP